MAILKNTARLLIGRIASDGLAILFFICLARTFGESGMGDYSFAFSVAALVGLGVEFGFRPLVTRNISRKHEMAVDYFGNLIVLQTMLSLLLGLVLYLTIRKLSYSGELRILCILAFIAASLRAMGFSFVAFLEAKEAMGKSAILEVISRLIIVVIGFAMILAGARLQTILFAYISGSFVFALIALYWTQKLFGPLKIKVNPDFIIKILREALPFAGASALYTLYARMDVMMLYYFCGKQETGLYAVAFRCVESSLIVASMVGLSIYPVLSKAYTQGDNELNQVFYQTLKWLGILGMAGAVVLFTNGDRILVFLFSKKFSGSEKLIRWMGLLFLIGCIKVPYWRLMFAANRESSQLVIQGISVGANLILNFFLIPLYGAFGAVWASIISEVILLIGFHWHSSKEVVMENFSSNLIRLFLAGLIALFVGLSTRYILLWPIGVSLTFGTFLVMIKLLGLFNKNEQLILTRKIREVMGTA